MKLNANRIAALIRVRDHGPEAWCEGRGRAGGAVSRMFDEMAAQGLVTRAPHCITPQGLQAIIDWEASRRGKKT